MIHRSTIAAMIGFFVAPVLLLAAGLDSHWIDAGNHGISRWYGPRYATICETGTCRSFAYSNEIRRLRKSSDWRARYEKEAHRNYIRDTLDAGIQLSVVRLLQVRARRLAWVLILSGLVYLLLGAIGGTAAFGSLALAYAVHRALRGLQRGGPGCAPDVELHQTPRRQHRARGAVHPLWTRFFCRAHEIRRYFTKPSDELVTPQTSCSTQTPAGVVATPRNTGGCSFVATPGQQTPVLTDYGLLLVGRGTSLDLPSRCYS